MSIAPEPRAKLHDALSQHTTDLLTRCLAPDGVQRHAGGRRASHEQSFSAELDPTSAVCHQGSNCQSDGISLAGSNPSPRRAISEAVPLPARLQTTSDEEPAAGALVGVA